ncbi:MAG: hypothetical protein ACNYPF_05050 [Candidatus Puniceispirillales bacterium WSBS_2018_MAG_OTU23]
MRYSKQTSFAAAVVLAMAAAVPAVASTVNNGLNAYHAGKYDAASAIFKPLSEGGNASAQNHLGYLYAQGHGVQQDHVRAYMWFSISAAMGEHLAKDNRDSVVLWMTATDVEKAQNMAVSCVKRRLKNC